MAKQSKTNQTVKFTATETIALPSEDSFRMAIRLRDWNQLKRTVSRLSSGSNPLEITFTVSTTVFFSFIIPTLTPSGASVTWRLVFAAICILSFGIATTSLVTLIAVKKAKVSERTELIELMDEIESMFPEDEVKISGTDSSINNLKNPTYSQSTVIDNDDLYLQSKAIAYEMGKVSTSLLQRKLRIGYGRAARLVDRMEKEGIVGESDGSRPRTVYPSNEEIIAKAQKIIES